MKILVVGGGGREHALCWKLSSSSLVDKLYCAPGNAGIERCAECVPIDAENVEKIVRFAVEQSVDMVLVGPEAPLMAGLSDILREKKIKVFGPTKSAAEIEGSKAFSKDLMKVAKIPTSSYKVFADRDKAWKHIKKTGTPIVVKADGLAAGKGVIICASLEEASNALELIMVKKEFGDAGRRVVVEGFLEGEEASFIALTDGHTVAPLASAQDHKAVFDNDKGPNTGGMGAYSPAPIVTQDVNEKIMKKVMLPTVKAMEKIGRPYLGVLYAGLMIKNGAPSVLEFNARFGDPETQPQMVRMKSDLAEAMLATIEGRLKDYKLEWDTRPAVCVVMASGGYPGKYEKGKTIQGIEDAEKLKDVVVFHAGTKKDGTRIVTNGGRVLGVTALGADIQSAINRAYEAAAKIHWDGVHYRKDIGAKALVKPNK